MIYVSAREQVAEKGSFLNINSLRRHHVFTLHNKTAKHETRGFQASHQEAGVSAWRTARNAKYPIIQGFSA